MKELKFNNSIFNEGINLTVRNGIKWAFVKSAFIAYLGYPIELHRQIFKFSDLKNYSELLLDEHDPECRTYDGLLSVMKETYPDFNEDNIVTLIWFNTLEH